MTRSMSSRFLFSASCSYIDLENPPDPPQKMPKFLVQLLPLPRVYATLTKSTRHTLLLSLLFLFLCYQTHCLRCTMICLPPTILFVIYFLFKKRSRLMFPGPFNKKRSKFYIGEDVDTKKSRRLICRPNTELSSDGVVYAGEFYKGSRTGRGVIKIPGKSTYMGDWIDGLYDGYGVEKLASCGEYKGKFCRGFRHGFGSMWLYNGDQYNGEWRHGERNGMGEEICACGNFYVGQFRRGMKHGIGIYCFRNGDIYLGEYFCGKFLGFGVYEFCNGDYYHGSWHDGQMAGYGIYTKRDGEMLSGLWVDGALVTRTPPIYPCIQNAVKAAMKAAEKCRSLPRMDYHVFQAVYEASNTAKAAQHVAINISKEKDLHPFDPMRIISWMCHAYADRLNSKLRFESAKKAMRELSYCLKATPSIRIALLAFRKFSGRCKLILTESKQVEEYLVSQPQSRSTPQIRCLVLSPKKCK